MERKIAKLLVLTGLVLGATVSLIPLTSYAIDSDPLPEADATAEPTAPVEGDTVAEKPAPSNEIIPPADATTTPLAEPTASTSSLSEPPQSAETGYKPIVINVDSKISLDTAEGTTTPIQVIPNRISTGTISATVSSTQDYNILLSASNPNLSNGAQQIAAKSDQTSGNDAWWGIKAPSATDYTGLTQTGVSFFSGAAGDIQKQTIFEVGISVPYNITPGSYQTEVTIIAAPST